MARSKKADSIQVIEEGTEQIREVNIYDLTRDAYLNFGSYINNWRQLPQILDGLKISYRRLLYSALQLPKDKMIKSANLLGKMMECFTGDTEILDVNGNSIRIEDLYRIYELGGDPVYVFSCDKFGKPSVSKILNVIDKGERLDLIKVTLDNDQSFICTDDHLIMLRSGSYIKASRLTEGVSLMPVYLEIKWDYTLRRFIKDNSKDDEWIPIYTLSSDHSDCVRLPETLRDTADKKDWYDRHHSDFNSLNDYPTNIKLIGHKYHWELHDNDTSSRNRKNWKIKSYRDKMVAFLKKSNSEMVEKFSKIIIDALKDFGLEFNEENYSKMREEIKAPTGKKCANIDVLYRKHRKFLEENGFDFSSYKEKVTIDFIPDPSTLPEGLQDMKLLTHVLRVMNLILKDNFSGVLDRNIWESYERKLGKSMKCVRFESAYYRFPDLMKSFGIDLGIEYEPTILDNLCPRKKKLEYLTRAKNVMLSLKRKNLSLTREEFNKERKELGMRVTYDYVNRVLPGLLSEDNFRKIGTKTLIKSDNRSIDYTNQMKGCGKNWNEGIKRWNHKVKSVEKVSLGKGVHVYDIEVDSECHNFSLSAGVFVHNCHPHSTDGSYGIVAAYVKTGIFSGQGFFGIRSIDGSSSPAAAPRYTEVRVSDEYREILGRLIKKVPYVESPNGPLEPVYICTPLPMSLYCSDSSISGLGLGISTDLPNFSPKSLYEAYINDDPMLLEPGIDIGLDKSKSELHKLWNEGRGRVTYFYRTSRIKSPDGNPGMLIEGDAGIFIPRLKRIKDWQAEGKVYMEDMVTQDGAKLAIFKVPNIKSISIDDIEAEVNKVCVNNMTYNLNVSDGKSAFRIPLREWIKATYTNYINLVNSDNADQIADTMFDIEVYSNIEVVANYIINENPKADNDEICRATGVRPEVVSSIMTRTISTLRKTKDQTDKVKALKSKLKELKSFDAVKFTDEIVKKL